MSPPVGEDENEHGQEYKHRTGQAHDLVSRSALKSEAMVQSYLLNEAQHLVFHDLSGPSMIQRKVPRSLRPSSKGLCGQPDANAPVQTLTRRDKARKTYLSKESEVVKKKESKREKKPKKEKKDKTSRTTKSTRSSSSQSQSDRSDFTAAPGSPVSYLLQELRKIAPEGTAPRTYPSLQMTQVFSEWTDEQMKAYDKESIAALRSRNVPLMRSWHMEGRTLQAANNFGESLLHMACRRGFLEVVRFLVDECGHDLWIRDDTGRTPLHDACWTTEPCPELVDYIVAKDCDMLLVCDKRGHTPLDYARKDHWEFWIQHWKTKDIYQLLPKRDIFYTSAAGSTPACQKCVIVENLESFMSELNLEGQPNSLITARRTLSIHASQILEESPGKNPEVSRDRKHVRRRRSKKSFSSDSSYRIGMERPLPLLLSTPVPLSLSLA